MSKKIIGNFIRKERNAKKMSQKQLADKLNYLAADSISKIELGHCFLPLEKAKTLADALEIPKANLFNLIRTNDPRVKILADFKMENPPARIKVIDARTQLFTYNDHQLTTITDDKGNPWWVAKEVCDVLEIQNTTQATKILDDDERSMYYIGRQGEVNIVNEPGLYHLILKSRKPQAKEFKRWVTHEVLPTIRKTGKYEIAKTPLPSNPLVTAIQSTLIEKMASAAMETLKKYDSDFETTSQKLIAATKRTKTANKKLVDANNKLRANNKKQITRKDYFQKQAIDYYWAAETLKKKICDLVSRKGKN